MLVSDACLTIMTKKHIFSGLLLITVLALVGYYRDEIMDALYDIQKGWGVAGFFCIMTNYILRALRLNLLTERELTIWPHGIYCTSMHGFLNYMLPLRSGDLSLPFLLKTTARIDLKKGATVLLKARVLEVFTLGVWITLAALVPFSNLPNSILWTMFFLGVVMMLTPFVLHHILKRLHLPFDRVQRITQHLAQIGRMTAIEIVLTFGIWASIAACIGCIAKAMQLSISIPDIVFLIALQLVMQLMPVQGIANSGNHESGWVAALMLMDYSGDSALQFALTSHAIILVYVLCLGLIAFMLKLKYLDNIV